MARDVIQGLVDRGSGFRSLFRFDQLLVLLWFIKACGGGLLLLNELLWGRLEGLGGMWTRLT